MEDSQGTIALVIPIVAIAGWLLYAIGSVVMRSRIRELEVRARIAMIEKGMVPPPERDPTIRQGYAGGETRMQIFARVTNVKEHFGVTIKADIPDDHPVVDSWISVYAGANWHEREAHEMFGIGFAGHNDLRNMYLPMEFEGHPMRKDFPLLARIVKPWPGIVDVEQLPGGDDDEEEEATT